MTYPLSPRTMTLSKVLRFIELSIMLSTTQYTKKIVEKVQTPNLNFVSLESYTERYPGNLESRNDHK